MGHTVAMSGRGLGKRRWVAQRVAATLVCSLVGVAAAPAQVGSAPASSSFVAVAPCRLADTRLGTGFTRISATTIEVQVSGRCELPDALTAAAFVVTAVSPSAPGYVTVYPAHLGAPPTTSNLNTHVGQTRANGAIVQVSAEGRVRVYSPAGGQVVLDATGGFVAAVSATGGRLVTVTPVRAFDSRTSGAGSRVAANTVVTVPLPAGVPTDAVAVAVTLTAVGAVAPGFATAFAAGSSAGDASHLNYDTVDGERASGTIVQVSPGGLALRASTAVHLIVDVTGYFTGATAADSSNGLFVAIEPKRLIDTRYGSALGLSVPLYPDGSVDVALALPAAAAAVNLTVTATSGHGSLSARAGGGPLPPTSSVNSGHRSDTAAALWMGTTSTSGVRVSVAAMSAHVIVDQFGWFTGTVGASAGIPAANVPNGTGCLPGVGKLDPTKRWYRQDNTSASTSSIGFYPNSGPRGALAVMGDSLTWQTMSGTMNRLIDAGFGPICADGAVFRATTVAVAGVNSGVNATNRLKTVAFWTAPTVRWVVGIGTNDVGAAGTTAAQRSRIDGMMSAIGVTTRPVLWINVRTRRGDYQAAESRFNAALVATPNLRVIDWSAMVAPSPATYITSYDMVHLTATGIAQRPVLVANTLVALS